MQKRRGSSFRTFPRDYEVLAELLPESTPVRLAVDGRDMEIMVKGLVHDHFARRLELLVMTVAEALRIRILPQGETTWIRPEIARGRGRQLLYLNRTKIAAGQKKPFRSRSNNVKDYPNPDLVVEVDISPPEATGWGIYARDARPGGLAIRRPNAPRSSGWTTPAGTRLWSGAVSCPSGQPNPAVAARRRPV